MHTLNYRLGYWTPSRYNRVAVLVPGTSSLPQAGGLNLVQPIPRHFALHNLPHHYSPFGQLALWHFPHRQTLPMDNSPHGHFAPWTTCLMEKLSHGQLASWTTCPTDNSPHGQLTPWTTHPMDNSARDILPYGHFGQWAVSSITLRLLWILIKKKLYRNKKMIVHHFITHFISSLYCTVTLISLDSSPDDISPIDKLSPWTTRPMDISPHGPLASWKNCPMDNSPHGQLAPRTTRPMDNSPHGQLCPGHFALWSFRPMGS
jgi:hypothetical protein